VIEAARAALAAWGGGGTLRPIATRENAVFEVAVAGTRAALRLHRPGYQARTAIESELWWCAALADAGFSCPRPLATRDGALVAEAGGRLASLVTWCPGQPMADPAAADFGAIGDLVARLHLATDALALPPWFQRPAWDADAFLGDAPRWGRFWENPDLSAPEQAQLLDARDAAIADLARDPEADRGLIHSDVLRENVLAGGSGLWLIDFDDSGFGFRISDIASVLIQYWDAPSLADFARAAVSGYAGRRDPGPDVFRRLTRALMLRGFASCGWIVTRAAPGDPRRRGHARRALALARLWREGGSVA
jgi:Ser/Thr protein kinase RdoA (MazF antagonist)